MATLPMPSTTVRRLLLSLRELRLRKLDAVQVLIDKELALRLSGVHDKRARADLTAAALEVAAVMGAAEDG